MIPNPYKGAFVVFEGMDGCGKTTQLNKTYAWLRPITQPGLSENLIAEVPRFSLSLTKEPGKLRFFGQKIYADLTNTSPDALHKKDPYGFQAWYASDSKENLENNIIPALRVGNVVLCDRFRPSMVYGATGPDDIPELMSMNQAIIGESFIWPDAVLIFGVPVEDAIERLKKNGLELDGHEKTEVLYRVRRNYLAFKDNYPNCHFIGAGRPPEEVFEDVKKIITNVLESKNKPV